ncbi:MAG: 1,4-dihydroxy-2-naphthoate polyprenyltransferase [Actinobacteria bacterium]|uniref:1,4-dihydroxy-2-naphthoate octaprenyltransferase n=1 Tax=Nostocoides veronense TaxID=330836 RepID=A0ABN2L9W8_9MICO|nr:1,4-dihydroxy-2-naphthoate polyprenyltransferase [Actinomycetota bacterium]
MATPAQWVAGARPRTLPAAVAPVLVGTGAAAQLDREDFGLALLALLVSLALQVGVNYANDYSDGVRGTDEARVGPVRLVGQRLADPRHVKVMAFGFFGLAGLAGLALCALAGTMNLLWVGAAAILAAWYYTGGKRPYGYRGLGEPFVFVFFGLVATLGTMWTQAHALSVVGVLGAYGVGALATALMVTNNLRDLPSDREAEKLTLAVRWGDAKTRSFYAFLVISALFTVLMYAVSAPWALLAFLAAPLGLQQVARVARGARGRDLIPVLEGTGRTQLVYAVLLTLGLFLA